MQFPIEGATPPSRVERMLRSSPPGTFVLTS